MHEVMEVLGWLAFVLLFAGAIDLLDIVIRVAVR